jgi:hypothetical protein
MTTPTNSPVHVASAPELAKYRGAGIGTMLGIAIAKPATIYTARIDQATFEDGLAQLTYDTGSGTLADVLVGMTVFVGSDSGLFDRGVYRTRQLPTASKIYINQTSANAMFQNGDYITILDEFRIWQRDITNAGGIVSMDYDIEFGDYQNGGVIPRIGPLMAVVYTAQPIIIGGV